MSKVFIKDCSVEIKSLILKEQNSLLKEIPIETFDIWYSKTKDFGGTAEEYGKLADIFMQELIEWRDNKLKELSERKK